MLNKFFNKKIIAFPGIVKLEEGPVLDVFNSLKNEKEKFETYIPVKLGSHLYYSGLYFTSRFKNPEMSKLVIVDEKGNILKDKEKAYKICLAVNLFMKSVTIENIKYIMKDIEALDGVKKHKSKADYYVPTGKLFLSKKDAEILEKSLENFSKHENTAKQLLTHYVDGLNRSRNLDFIDYKEFMDLIDSYINAGFERVKAKENLMKFSELIKLAKKTLKDKEDEFLDTEAGSFHMLDRFEAYARKDPVLLEHMYKNVREYFTKRMAEDEAKDLMTLFNNI
ncbi:MAG: hypothetical protein KO464_09185 [Candidatus Methanofastidiosum sp.]|nr:hypothetical protein [Methanofastidiosum sp.]